MARTDDLAALFAGADDGGPHTDGRDGDGAEVGFHQGVIASWDVMSGTGTVRIGGSSFTDVPVFTTGEATSLASGDVVGVFRAQHAYFILGRIAGPGQLNRGAASAGRGLLPGGYTSIDAPSTVDVTTAVHQLVPGLRCTVTPDPNRLLRVTLMCSVISTASGERCVVGISEPGLGLPAGYTGPLTEPAGPSYNQLGVFIQERGATVNAGPRAEPVALIGIDDRGLGGERTYRVSLENNTGTGTANIDADPPGPTTLTVEDIGPIT